MSDQICLPVETEVSNAPGVHQIIFRCVKDDPPARFWHVEIYSDEGTLFPVGIAYVAEVASHNMAQLNLLFIIDQWRGGNFAAVLFRAVKNRWPNLQKTSRMR